MFSLETKLTSCGSYYRERTDSDTSTVSSSSTLSLKGMRHYASRSLDYIPGISTVKSIVVLFYKGCRKLSGIENPFKANLRVKIITGRKDSDIRRLVIAAIPIFGNLGLFLSDFATRNLPSAHASKKDRPNGVEDANNIRVFQDLYRKA